MQHVLRWPCVIFSVSRGGKCWQKFWGCLTYNVSQTPWWARARLVFGAGAWQQILFGVKWASLGRFSLESISGGVKKHISSVDDFCSPWAWCTKRNICDRCPICGSIERIDSFALVLPVDFCPSDQARPLASIPSAQIYLVGFHVDRVDGCTRLPH